MQQLFPEEGETVPRLRFPKFWDVEEWEEKKLSSIVLLISGMHLLPDQYASTGDIPYFTGPSEFRNNAKEIKKWSRVSENVAKENDILITVKGSGVGELWYLKFPSVAIGRQLMSIRATDCSSRFIFQFLLTKRTRFGDLASGNLIPGLSRSDILELGDRFPQLPEQKKIAESLFIIDEIITTQTQKVDFLKEHKKGLMQQLFPTQITD